MLKRFEVDFEYTVPQFTTIEVEAEDEDDALVLAEEVFEQAYPEADEVFEISAREING